MAVLMPMRRRIGYILDRLVFPWVVIVERVVGVCWFVSEMCWWRRLSMSKMCLFNSWCRQEYRYHDLQIDGRKLLWEEERCSKWNGEWWRLVVRACNRSWGDWGLWGRRIGARLHSHQIRSEVHHQWRMTIWYTCFEKTLLTVDGAAISAISSLNSWAFVSPTGLFKWAFLQLVWH